MEKTTPIPKQQKWKRGPVPHGMPFIAGDDPTGKGKPNPEVVMPTPQGNHVMRIKPRDVKKMKMRKCGWGTASVSGPTWVGGDANAIGEIQRRARLGLGSNDLRQRNFTQPPARRPNTATIEDAQAMAAANPDKYKVIQS